MGWGWRWGRVDRREPPSRCGGLLSASVTGGGLCLESSNQQAVGSRHKGNGFHFQTSRSVSLTAELVMAATPLFGRFPAVGATG